MGRKVGPAPALADSEASKAASACRYAALRSGVRLDHWMPRSPATQ